MTSSKTTFLYYGGFVLIIGIAVVLGANGFYVPGKKPAGIICFVLAIYEFLFRFLTTRIYGLHKAAGILKYMHYFTWIPFAFLGIILYFGL